jgi:hypothetical protein
MNREQGTGDQAAARMDAAIDELRQMISRRYPNAAFATTHGDDPKGVYLIPTVDVEDTEAVFDVVVERLLQLQIDDELPVYVIPVQPEARVREEFRSPRPHRRTIGIRRLEALGVRG